MPYRENAKPDVEELVSEYKRALERLKEAAHYAQDDIKYHTERIEAAMAKTLAKRIGENVL